MDGKRGRLEGLSRRQEDRVGIRSIVCRRGQLTPSSRSALGSGDGGGTTTSRINLTHGQAQRLASSKRPTRCRTLMPKLLSLGSICKDEVVQLSNMAHLTTYVRLYVHSRLTRQPYTDNGKRRRRDLLVTLPLLPLS